MLPFKSLGSVGRNRLGKFLQPGPSEWTGKSHEQPDRSAQTVLQREIARMLFFTRLPQQVAPTIVEVSYDFCFAEL